MLNGFRTPTHARLSAALSELADAGDVTRKQVQMAADTSRTTVATWFSGERVPDLAEYNLLLQDLPEAPALVIAGVAHFATGYCIRASDAASGAAGRPLAESEGKAICMLQGVASLMEQRKRAVRDRIVTAEEAAGLKRQTAFIRQQCDEFDALVDGHTARPAAVG